MPDLDAPDRLRAVRASGLHGLTERERGPFDRLVRLACDQLGVPMAALSLIGEDRQELVAAHGMERLDFPARDGLCVQVVRTGASLVVPDSRYEEGYGADSLPAREGVISYAGVPLRNADGDVLGSLCAAQTRPKVWTAAEVGLLEELSEIGTAELLLRSTAATNARAQRRIGAVVASSLDAIVTMDVQGLVTEFNPAAERMFGRRREEAMGRRLSTLIIPEALRAAHEAGREHNVATGEHRVLDQRLELSAVRADGTEFPVELTVTRTDAGGEISFTGFLRDLSSQRLAERALKEAETRLALTVESAPIGLFALDAHGRVTVADGSALKAFGAAPADLIGRSAFELYAKRPDVLADLERALAGETLAVTHRFGTLVFEMRARPIADGGGVAGIALDVSERFRDQARIAELAYVDRLTRLLNRAGLEEAVGRSLGAEAWAAGRTAALLFVDLDDFQTVNDSLGHAAGDEVLREAADRLRGVLEPDGKLARQGADEFIVFLDDLGGDPQGVAERFALESIAALEAPFAVAGLEFHVEASVGIALFPQHGDGYAELLRGAESALHRAKQTGGRSLAVHRRDDVAARRRLTMSARLRRALVEEQFVLHYQPIFDLADGRPVGVEALLRWDDPALGRIPPLDFIPIAEATGLVVPIGAWVAETACRQAVAWREMGLAIGVGFNVSPVQLERGDFACQLATIIERTGAEARSLVVEVTESVAMEGGAEAEAALGRLADLGVAVVIDDFGAGHSSLTRLRQLRVGSLKIDRALLDGVPEDAGAAAVVSASLALADALGIPTVAEGVETEAQRTFLRDRGCRYAQGFGLARPMAAAEVTELLLAAGAPRVGALTGG